MRLSAKIIKKFFPIEWGPLRKNERTDENKKNCPLNENSS